MKIIFDHNYSLENTILITQKNLLPLAKPYITGKFLTFPEGEEFKTRETKALLEDQLSSLGTNRDTTLVAFGGGVVTDLVGFLASTYCRGIDLILIPTTLLAMCDAAIGGKTAVNTPFGKNLIGTFYLPKAVIIDTKLLNTLPEKEWLNGRAEIIKYALLFDQNILNLPLLPLIKKCIKLKLSIVKEDFQDHKKRELLNFGHTLGHALEFTTKKSHGEALLLGMQMESFIAYRLSLISHKKFLKIKELINFPPFSYSPQEVKKALLMDKKRRGGKTRLSLFTKVMEVPQPLLDEALTAFTSSSNIC